MKLINLPTSDFCVQISNLWQMPMENNDNFALIKEKLNLTPQKSAGCRSFLTKYYVNGTV